MHQDGNAFVPLLMLKEVPPVHHDARAQRRGAVDGTGRANEAVRSEVRGYGIAGLLHDLGKVKVPLEIVQKPGALTPEEVAIMRSIRSTVLDLILDSDSRLDLSAAVAFEHHIMIDGGGYPTRRSRRECHHASMLVHVCDVFDALRILTVRTAWAWETNAIVDFIRQRAESSSTRIRRASSWPCYASATSRTPTRRRSTDHRMRWRPALRRRRRRLGKLPGEPALPCRRRRDGPDDHDGEQVATTAPAANAVAFEADRTPIHASTNA